MIEIVSYDPNWIIIFGGKAAVINVIKFLVFYII